MVARERAMARVNFMVAEVLVVVVCLEEEL
jgi:hypothetical protein